MRLIKTENYRDASCCVLFSMYLNLREISTDGVSLVLSPRGRECHALASAVMPSLCRNCYFEEEIINSMELFPWQVIRHALLFYGGKNVYGQQYKGSQELQFESCD